MNLIKDWLTFVPGWPNWQLVATVCGAFFAGSAITWAMIEQRYARQYVQLYEESNRIIERLQGGGGAL